MLFGLVYRLFTAVVDLLIVRAEPRRALEAEVVVLRHQVAVLQRTARRPELNDSDRALLAGIGRLLPRSTRANFIVAPDTLMRWHRRLASRRWVHVLFFIEHATRRVHLAGITQTLNGTWCTQTARNLSTSIDLGRFRFLIRDNATVFVTAFDAVFTSEGTDVIRTPPGAPRANAIAERFVRTVRTELLDRTLIWNEAQLRRLLVDHREHYNRHRPDRRIAQRSPDTPDHTPADTPPIETIRRRPILGGLINEYHRAA